MWKSNKLRLEYCKWYLTAFRGKFCWFLKKIHKMKDSLKISQNWSDHLLKPAHIHSFKSIQKSINASKNNPETNPNKNPSDDPLPPLHLDSHPSKQKSRQNHQWHQQIHRRIIINLWSVCSCNRSQSYILQWSWQLPSSLSTWCLTTPQQLLAALLKQYRVDSSALLHSSNMDSYCAPGQVGPRLMGHGNQNILDSRWERLVGIQ